MEWRTLGDVVPKTDTGRHETEPDAHFPWIHPHFFGGALKNSADGFPWEDLQITLAILRDGSLSRAAATLGIRQSTASRRLSRLEQAMGASLFDRTPEGMAPTNLALEMQTHIEEIELRMSDIHRTVSAQNGSPAGRVRIALPDGFASVWLIPGMADFHRTFPDIILDLVIGNAVVDLVRREADIALRLVRPTDPDLVAQRLARVAMAPFVHSSLAGSPVESLRWILFDDPDRHYLETRWVMDHVSPERTMTVSLWNAMFASVKSGVGPAILSVWVAEQAGLVRIEHPVPVEEREVFVVYHRALRNVPRIAAVRTWLQERARLFGAAASQGLGDRSGVS
ncbi:MAG: DNA-binding transcriptional LysR family regulator [Myxococcota bacterium]|jgi:DNA-binding transcriptional LysR family regulator